MTLSASWRYAVVGIYKDRDWSTWHVYPLPFVRLTFGRVR